MQHTTVQYIIDNILTAFDKNNIKKMNLNSSRSDKMKNRIHASKELKQCINKAIKKLDINVHSSVNLEPLAEINDYGDIYIRPRNLFRTPIYYEMVLIHEISHELYNLTLKRSGVSRWSRNNINTVKVRWPALALEEIIVELSSILVTMILSPGMPNKYYGPSFYYIRERLSDLSAYGLRWTAYEETLSYCIAKSLNISFEIIALGKY